jgi:hypothetical protein
LFLCEETVYKVNPEIDTHRYDAYVERHTMMMSFISIKKKMKDTKVYVSLYLTGHDSQN